MDGFAQHDRVRVVRLDGSDPGMRRFREATGEVLGDCAGVLAYVALDGPDDAQRCFYPNELERIAGDGDDEGRGTVVTPAEQRMEQHDEFDDRQAWCADNPGLVEAIRADLLRPDPPTPATTEAAARLREIADDLRKIAGDMEEEVWKTGALDDVDVGRFARRIKDEARAVQSAPAVTEAAARLREIADECDRISTGSDDTYGQIAQRVREVATALGGRA